MSSVDTLLDNDSVFLTAGGLETTLYFRSDFPLREMASFEALLSPTWRDYVDRLQTSFADIALRYGRPLLLETETWRASSHWFDKLGTSKQDRESISQVAMDCISKVGDHLRVGSSGRLVPVIQGVVGPRRDGYCHDKTITFEVACDYHREQVRSLKEAGVQLITPTTITSSEEAKAIAVEANKVNLPCAISFTLETNGHLPSGESLQEAICRIDEEVNPRPLLYMINCVHPKHIRPVIAHGLDSKASWIHRLRGIRANASSKSHEELDNSQELDEGNPAEWAREMLALRQVLPTLSIMGGCCDTGIRHCEELAKLLV